MDELNYYPYINPIILTDSIFIANGGLTGSSTAAQRNVAYWLAEVVVSGDLRTYLTPTIVSGTYLYQPRIRLDHAYVSQVFVTRLYDYQESLYYTISGTANMFQSLHNPEYGILDAPGMLSYCCSPYLMTPYKMQVVYQTGLPSGTVYRPDVLLGLATVAQLELNEIIGFGNEAPGDVAVSEYRNQMYQEKRKGLKNTNYGGSPKANFAHRLLSRLRLYRVVGW